MQISENKVQMYAISRFSFFGIIVNNQITSISALHLILVLSVRCYDYARIVEAVNELYISMITVDILAVLLFRALLGKMGLMINANSKA